MSAFRIVIVLILLLVVGIAIWRLQRFKAAKLITRWVLFPFLILFFISSWISSGIVENAAENKVYSDVNLVPYRDTALVLGANKNSAPSFFFNRIEAAATLYKAGKVK